MPKPDPEKKKYFKHYHDNIWYARTNPMTVAKWLETADKPRAAFLLQAMVGCHQVSEGIASPSMYALKMDEAWNDVIQEYARVHTNELLEMGNE